MELLYPPSDSSPTWFAGKIGFSSPSSNNEEQSANHLICLLDDCHITIMYRLVDGAGKII
jgi:hypothetical protein